MWGGGGGGVRGFNFILFVRLKGFAGNFMRFSTTNPEPLSYKAYEVHKARHGASHKNSKEEQYKSLNKYQYYGPIFLV